jgi:hypothetical protein
MTRLGFEFQETMAGTYTLAGQAGPPRRVSFTVRAVAGDVLQHLRDGACELEGTFDMEGFADDVPCRGSLEIAPLTKRIIRYELAFAGNDGEPYRLAGQKDIKLSDLVHSMTTLDAAIHDGKGVEIARARVRFDLRADLLPFLVSWKPQLAG